MVEGGALEKESSVCRNVPGGGRKIVRRRKFKTNAETDFHTNMRPEHGSTFFHPSAPTSRGYFTRAKVLFDDNP